MTTLKKKCSKTFSVAELLALAGVEMKKPMVDRTGTDDGNAVTLHTKDSVLVFSKADLLAYEHTMVDGLKIHGARKVAGLPMGDLHERHEDGRAHDHVDAAITIDRSGSTDDEAVTLRWVE